MPAPHPYLRAFAPLFAMYAAMLAASVAILTLRGISVSQGSAESMALAAALVAGLIGLGCVLRSDLAMLATLTSAAFIGMIAPLSILSYALTSLGAVFPLQDQLFASIDSFFQLDWLATVSFLNGSPLLIAALDASYHYTIFGMIYALVFLNVVRLPERVLEFFWGVVLTCLSVGLVAALLPAVGAYPYYAPSQEARSAIAADAGVWHLGDFEALRNRTFVLFELNKTEGLVTFPSFHTAMALLIPLAMRGYGLVTAAAWVFALVVVVSTIPIGGHYFIDVVAGAALTFLTMAGLARVQWIKNPEVVLSPATMPQAASQLRGPG
jgi:membrane-associated phospholipid phosphatase